MIFDPILDIFRGKAVTIPPMDGAFRPNNMLDEAPVFSELAGADNIVCYRGRVVASSGHTLYNVAAGQVPSVPEVFAASISALSVSPGGELAIALDNGQLFCGGRQIALPAEIRCITALAFGEDGTLWLANGSAAVSPADWTRDLMSKGASGSVWKNAPGQPDFTRATSGLAYPNGLLPVGGGVVVSESWRHRLVRVDAKTGERRVVLARLPGYPARLAKASDGGAWLAIFAPLNRLIEFVLQEEQYRQSMIAEVPPPFWIAPALASNRSFLEPLQCGAIRSMGIHKPWSPSRSYGLVVKLNADLQPVTSYHSRASGVRHGVTSVMEGCGKLYVACQGGDVIVTLDLAETGGH
jgi:hypothetical protein